MKYKKTKGSVLDYRSEHLQQQKEKIAVFKVFASHF